MTPLKVPAVRSYVFVFGVSFAFVTVAVVPLRTIVVLPLKTSPPSCAVCSSAELLLGKPIVPPLIPSALLLVLNVGGPLPQPEPLYNQPLPEFALTSTRSLGLCDVRPNAGAPQTAMLSSFVWTGPLSSSPARNEIVEQADGRSERGWLHEATVDDDDVSASGSSVS